ncbi:MucR family transcriptional regulator [Frigidibacter sp. MR17.24]|uniref:MucR family transcriptional regulator n=1 Tax=Frigidibacter sp. MR17.24 TaxID=3127345 RepID=UPI003012C411
MRQLIHNIGRLIGLGPAPIPVPVPPVSVADSIMQDHLVCLETGERVVLLGSHLSRRFGMTPAQYRRRWGLADSYPMVAPAYAAQRRRVAGAGPPGDQA